MLTKIEGYIDITIRVPFTALDDAEEGQAADATAWMNAVNDGSLPDAMEGAEVPPPDYTVHEIVASEVVEAWQVTPDHNHDSRCCATHGHHAMPHKGCILR